MNDQARQAILEYVQQAIDGLITKSEMANKIENYCITKLAAQNFETEIK